MTYDQLFRVFWINGLRDPAHIYIRTRVLQTMESRPDVTLLQLEGQIKRLLDLKVHSKCVAGSTPSHAAEINAKNSSRTTIESKVHHHQTNAAFSEIESACLI
uniref:Uncharacterized protein n=1 Tax=Caenorhabditis japonica TaxID=281687 RepID=A0A8R1IMD5_CAEJA